MYQRDIMDLIRNFMSIIWNVGMKGGLEFERRGEASPLKYNAKWVNSPSGNTDVLLVRWRDTEQEVLEATKSLREYWSRHGRDSRILVVTVT